MVIELIKQSLFQVLKKASAKKVLLSFDHWSLLGFLFLPEVPREYRGSLYMWIWISSKCITVWTLLIDGIFIRNSSLCSSYIAELKHTLRSLLQYYLTGYWLRRLPLPLVLSSAFLLLVGFSSISPAVADCVLHLVKGCNKIRLSSKANGLIYPTLQ